MRYGVWEWGIGFLDGIGFYYSQMCIGDGFIFNQIWSGYPTIQYEVWTCMDVRSRI